MKRYVAINTDPHRCAQSPKEMISTHESTEKVPIWMHPQNFFDTCCGWQVIHGNVSRNKRVNSFLMWAGSLPCVFGYFLYLRFGHLSHHNRMGGHSMAELFAR